MSFFKIIICVNLIFFSSLYSCELPNEKIKIFITKNEKSFDSYSPKIYWDSLMSKLTNSFDVVEENKSENIQVYISEMDSSSFPYEFKAIYTVRNPISNENFTNKIYIKSDCYTPTNDCVHEWRPKFIETTSNDIVNSIKKSKCSIFQNIFDIQIKKEKSLKQKQVAKNALEQEKENKRRIVLQRLVDKNDYVKLNKVIKIKPEYYELLDNKTKLMLLGPSNYQLWKILNELKQGKNEDSILANLNNVSYKYKEVFSPQEKTHLSKIGFSPKLIAYLEIHTQEIILKEKEQARLARLEEERNIAIRKAEEARKEKIRLARQEDERRQSKKNDEFLGKMLAIGMGAAIAGSSNLDASSKAEFITKYSTDVLNNDITMSNTKEWKNSTIVKNNQQQIKIQNEYKVKLQEIEDKKQKILTNSNYANQEKSIKYVTCYAMYTDGNKRIGDRGSSHDSKVVAIVEFEQNTGNDKWVKNKAHILKLYRETMCNSEHSSVNSVMQTYKTSRFKDGDTRNWRVFQ